MKAPIRVRSIGGEMALSPDTLSGPSVEHTPSFLPGPYLRWVNTGRAAIRLAIDDALKRGALPIVWIPAYCCESILQPFRYAGFEVRFYGGLPGTTQPSYLPDVVEGACFLFI